MPNLQTVTEVSTGIRGAKVIICSASGKYVKSPNCNRAVGTGIRGGKVIICCVSEQYVKSPNCNRVVITCMKELQIPGL